MAKLKIKKGDLVQVISGRSQKNGGDRGKQGKVIAVYPDTERVLVEGINRVTKHVKAGTTARGSRTGGLVHAEAPIHVSNVQLVVKVDGKEVVTRVGYKRVEVTKRRPDGSEYQSERSVRIARKTGEEI